MRACWFDDVVDHDGERFHYEGLQVRPQPTRLDVWLGGIAPSELRRVGRLADGWLPSFVTPADAAAGRAVIEQVAAEHDRAIEDDHYGVLIPYTLDAVPDVLLAQLARRRPDLDDPATLVPVGWDAADRHDQALRRRRHDEVRRPPGRRAAPTPPRGTPTSPTPPRPSSPSRPSPTLSCGALQRSASAEGGHRRVAAGDGRDAAAAAGAGAAHEHVGVRGLDAPAALVGGVSANGHCRSRWKMCPPGMPRSASISSGPITSMQSGSSRQSSIGSASTLSSDAQDRRPRPRPARRRGRRGTAAPACAGRTASASGRRRPAARADRIDGSVSEWQ